MNRRSLWITLAGVAIIAALVGWWLYTFEYVETETSAPLHGEARYNPFYALGKVLRARGVKVESHANLNLNTMRLAAGDALVLGADVRTLSHEQVKTLIDWIDSGGHLVFSLPQDNQGRGGDLLSYFSIKVVKAGDCLRWQIVGEKDHARYCPRFAFDIVPDKWNHAANKPEDAAAEFDLLVGDAEDGYLIGRRNQGDGDWLAASDLNFLHNTQLNSPGNTALAWQVLAPALGSGRVHLVYAADVPPLYVLLVRYGWPVLVPLMLALLAWLAARSQRFGPLLPLADANRRALLEHIRAAGEFEFRRGSVAAMYAALHRRFFERLRHRDPAIAALDGEALVTAVAVAYKRSPAQIRQALNPQGLAQPENFFTAVKTLHDLSVRR